MVPSLKFLALFLSLPLVLLSWSLIVFAFAVITYAFYESRTWWNYTLVGVVVATVLAIVGASIIFFWGIFEEKRATDFVSWWNNLWAPRPRISSSSLP